MTNTEFKIEKGVPLPEPRPERKRKTKYPWADMEPGDSFLIPNSMLSDKSANLGTSIAYNRNRRERNLHSGLEYRSEKVKEGIRVWRVK